MPERDRDLADLYDASLGPAPSWTPYSALYPVLHFILGLVLTSVVVARLFEDAGDIRTALRQRNPMLFAGLALLFVLWCLSFGTCGDRIATGVSSETSGCTR